MKYTKKQILILIVVPFLIGAIVSGATAGIITACNHNKGIK